MHSVSFLSVLLTAGTLAASQSTCTKDIIISQPTPVIDCDVVDANISVDEKLAGDLSIEGPKQLKGDLIINNATQLLSISSSSINSIGGTFSLLNLELLSNLQMSSLRTLNDITFIKLPQLSSLTFGSDGVTHASKVRISDTFLSDLSGLSLATVDTFQIDNNHKLTSFNSDLVNVTTGLLISQNGDDFTVNMTMLQSAAEVELSNIKSFEAPKLHEITASLRFDLNPQLQSFFADNLTSIAQSLAFNNNTKATNISFPALTKIGGDMTILNNTKLIEMEGFPKLKSVGGAILLGGQFQKVELPALADVKGSVHVTSTTDIHNFCNSFDQAKSNGIIQGPEKCTSNNTQADVGGNGGSTSSGSDSGDSGSAAGMNAVNMILLGITAVVGFAQLI